MDSVSRMRLIPFGYIPYVIEEAVPTQEFVSGVDVAIIATVEAIWLLKFDIENFSVLIELEEIVKGELRDGITNEIFRLRGDITEGGTYLMLFTSDENGNLTIASRSGSVIPIDSIEFAEFMDLFEQ